MRSRLVTLCTFSIAGMFMLVLTGCAKTFLVTKDCYSAFFDSGDKKMTRMLCDGNDFRGILESTTIAADRRDKFYEALCEKRSGEEVRRVYSSLTTQERESLKLSFQKHGYDINYKPVEASGVMRAGGLRENLSCPAQGPGF